MDEFSKQGFQSRKSNGGDKGPDPSPDGKFTPYGFVTPDGIVEFISLLVSDRVVSSLFDPMCGSGKLLQAVGDRTNARSIHGLDINISAVDQAREALGSAAEIRVGDVLHLASEESLRRYDLIVSEPPFDVPLRNATDMPGATSKFKGMLHDAAVCFTCDRLSEGGRAVLVLPAPFFGSKRSSAARAAIADLNCGVRACIQIPSGALQGTRVEAYIVVIDQGYNGPLFAAQYSADTKHQERLRANLHDFIPGKLASQGRICDWESFEGFVPIEARERLARMAVRRELEFVPMSDLVVDSKQYRRRGMLPNELGSNVVFLSNVYEPRATTELSDLSAKSDIVLIQVNADRVDPRYFAHAINGDVGEALLDQVRRGTVVSRFRVSDFMKLEFCIPSIDRQRKIVDATLELQRIRSEVDALEKSLWQRPDRVDELAKSVGKINREDTFEAWLETVPFPLASILWRHRVFDGSPRERYEILLHFFEAMAEFLAAIHLSAFASDDALWAQCRPSLQSAQKGGGSGLMTATFGTWRLIVEVLAKVARSHMQNDGKLCASIYRTHKKQVLEMLTSKRLIRILQNANSLRNTWHGHTGAIGDAQATEIDNQLFGLVEECREIMADVWDEYQLVQPQQSRFAEGVFRYQVRQVTGTRLPFRTCDSECVEPMEDGHLHLWDPDHDRVLQLLPLVRVMPSPATESNACYFYNRRQGEKIRFVSYHFSSDSEVTEEFSDVRAAIDGLGL